MYIYIYIYIYISRRRRRRSLSLPLSLPFLSLFLPHSVHVVERVEEDTCVWKRYHLTRAPAVSCASQPPQPPTPPGGAGVYSRGVGLVLLAEAR